MIDIFGTLGPACDDEETLAAMFKEGMSGIRINLSHVMLSNCEDSIKRIKSAAARCGVVPKILIDMQGPELRIGELERPLVLHEGDEFCLKLSENITEHLHVGKEILLDDGKILAEVVSVKEASSEDNGIRESAFKVLRGGILSSRKSIAIPGAQVDMPALTDTDKENLKLAKSFGITGVMQPFVRSAEDLKELRKELDMWAAEADQGSVSDGNICIYAKIENMTGVENLESFFPYADEIIIARGDLGNAMPLWELPKVQKRISQTCKEKGMPFMVVTQMLSSMEHSKVPTRAEVSDIYNAVADGASSLMVTGETAVGENPVEVISYLFKTAGTYC